MNNPSFIALTILLSACWASAEIRSSVYEWEKLEAQKTADGEVRSILSGPTQTLERFEIKAITLNPGTVVKERTAAGGLDELIIFKEGSAVVGVNGEEKTLGEGSVVVLSPGDRIRIENHGKSRTTFYAFQFKPRRNAAVDQAKATGPVLKDWKTLEFKATPNGGTRRIVRQPTSTLKQLEIHTTTLNEGLPSHAAHTHPDEEIILVRFGCVEETINDKAFKLGPGSVIFLSGNDHHGIRNAGSGQCEYYAMRWLTGNETK